MMAWLALILTVVLLGTFAKQQLGGRGALLAVVLFVSMPIVWLAGRGGAPQVVLLPSLAAWLLTFGAFARSERRWWLVAGGAAVAAMLYLHLAGLVLAAVYGAAGAGVIVALRPRNTVTCLVAFASGLLVAAAPFMVMLALDSAPVAKAITAFGLYDAQRFNPFQGAREIGSWVGLTVRTEVYWDSFIPALWFLGKGSFPASLMTSPIFLAPLVIPFVRGLWAYVISPADVIDSVVVVGLACAPAAIALIAQPPVPARLIVIAPFVAIIAARGCYPGAFRITEAGVPAASATVAMTR